LNGTIPVEVKLGDIDNSELKVKFNRTQVQSIISHGNVTLYISGKVNDAVFTGNSTIRVIENQRIDLDKENEKSEKLNKNKGGKF